ncbi:Pentatricopeptide repeat-containing protein, partial [Mucuna pruriens]
MELVLNFLNATAIGLLSIILVLVLYNPFKFGEGKEPPTVAGAWPILGHLPLLSASQSPHKTFGALADKYGTIFTFKLGARKALVINNWEVAKECVPAGKTIPDNHRTERARQATGFGEALKVVTTGARKARQTKVGGEEGDPMRIVCRQGETTTCRSTYAMPSQSHRVGKTLQCRSFEQHYIERIKAPVDLSEVGAFRSLCSYNNERNSEARSRAMSVGKSFGSTRWQDNFAYARLHINKHIYISHLSFTKLFQQLSYKMTKFFWMSSDNISLVNVLPSCASLAALLHGRQVHGFAIRSGLVNDVFVGNAVVDMYAKCGKVEEANKVFQRMKFKDVVSWNAMVIEYSQAGRLEHALSLFERMWEENIELDVVTWTAVITGYAQRGQGYEALDVFRQMCNCDSRPNAVTLVPLLSTCASVGALLHGKETHCYAIKFILNLDGHDDPGL